MDDSELAETAVAHGGERREGAGAAGQSAALGDYSPVSVAAGLPSVYAALDLGTNNCRLLVARRAGDAFRVVDAFSRIVRLGEGLENSGRLSEAAMDRTVAALAVCMRKLRYRRV